MGLSCRLMQPTDPMHVQNVYSTRSPQVVYKGFPSLIKAYHAHELYINVSGPCWYWLRSMDSSVCG